MKMSRLRNITNYGISSLAILIAMGTYSNSAMAQKVKKNKKSAPTSETAPVTEKQDVQATTVSETVFGSSENVQPGNTQNGPTEAQLRKQLESNLKFTPYYRTPPVKPNVFGNYPKLKNAPAWDGREAGVYSIRFKFRTITPAKATPKITNIYAGDTVYLADHNIGGKYLRDTAVIDKNGVANFHGTKKLQRGMYLFVFPKKRDYFEFIIDDDQDFQIDFDTAWSTRDYYLKMTATGSTENTAFIEYQKGKGACRCDYG